MGIFLFSGSRKKRQKGKQNATEQDSHQTMTAMEGNLSSYGYCSEENGNQTESRVEIETR